MARCKVMERPFSPDDIDRLMPRLERMARDLTIDASAADDLVQDAWLAGLQARPSALRHPVRWMQVVMRRRSALVRTRDRLRRESEELAADVESEVDPTVERASTAALLVEELNELDAPYRDVLHMRFLEERSIRDIAERSGRSPETVRSQVHRGLARLRERLDRRAGSRDAWAGLLVGLARRGPAPSEALPSDTAGPGVLSSETEVLGSSMFSWPAALALAVLTSGALFWFASSSSSASGAKDEPIVRETRPAPVPARESMDGTRAPAAFEAAPEARPDEPEPQAVPSDGSRLAIVVEDAEGRPLPAATVEVRHVGGDSVHFGPADAAGRLSIDIDVSGVVPDSSGRAVVGVSAWTEALTRPDVLQVEIRPGAERTLRVRLDQPSMTVRGRVVDPEGEPLPGAAIQVQVAAIERRDIEPGVTRIRKLSEAFTDASGEFVVEGVVPQPLLVFAGKRGFVARTAHVEPPVEGLEVITLTRGGIVAGFASHADGRPAAGARVWVGAPELRQAFFPETRADEDGFFLMSGLSTGEWEVFACDPARPNLFSWTRVLALPDEESPFEAVLRPTDGVRVRVLDREGTPVSAAGVVVTPVEVVSFWTAHVGTDELGRAQMLHVPDVPLEVRVYPTGEIRGNGDPSAFRSGVRAGDPELVVRLQTLAGELEDRSGRLRGLLLQSSGEALAGAQVFAVPLGSVPLPETPFGGPLLNDMGIGTSETRADGSFVVDDLSPGEYWVAALSVLPRCGGAFDLGRHTVLSAEATELGTRRAPEPHSVRFERTNFGDILMSAEVGPHWKPWIEAAGESLELGVLPGHYWIGTHETGGYFDVPGDSVVTVPQ